MTVDIALNRKDKDAFFPVNDKGFATILLINGADRITQKISMSLQMWLGEWYLDITKGVPYLEVIFDKQTRNATRESILRSVILDVQGVRRINSFGLNIDARSRVMNLVFSCDTVSGPIQGSARLDQSR